MVFLLKEYNLQGMVCRERRNQMVTRTACVEDIRSDRQFRALTGLSRKEFQQLLPTFTESYEELREEAYKEKLDTRERKLGGGQKGKLAQMSQKLFFMLYYCKVYPCYDVLGFHFGMDGSKACTNVQALWPVLKRTLDTLGVLPAREFASVEELRAAFAEITDLVIDATERPHVRPQDPEEQRKLFSGKKTAYGEEYHHHHHLQMDSVSRLYGGG
jgi:hypothetical protein